MKRFEYGPCCARLPNIFLRHWHLCKEAKLGPWLRLVNFCMEGDWQLRRTFYVLHSLRGLLDLPANITLSRSIICSSISDKEKKVSWHRPGVKLVFPMTENLKWISYTWLVIHKSSCDLSLFVNLPLRQPLKEALIYLAKPNRHLSYYLTKLLPSNLTKLTRYSAWLSSNWTKV